jgi:hypothetical protein
VNIAFSWHIYSICSGVISVFVLFCIYSGLGCRVCTLFSKHLLEYYSSFGLYCLLFAMQKSPKDALCEVLIILELSELRLARIMQAVDKMIGMHVSRSQSSELVLAIYGHIKDSTRDVLY